VGVPNNAHNHHGDDGADLYHVIGELLMALTQSLRNNFDVSCDSS
jgi:hypothetical protein